MSEKYIELGELVSKLADYKEALKFYADPQNWVDTRSPKCESDKDKGHRARQALKGEW